jgi:hypothetical protein
MFAGLGLKVLKLPKHCLIPFEGRRHHKIVVHQQSFSIGNDQFVSKKLNSDVEKKQCLVDLAGGFLSNRLFSSWSLMYVLCSCA